MCFVDEINGQCVQYVTGSDVQCPTCFRTLSIFLILKNTQVCRLYYLITHFLSPRKTCLSSLQNDSLNLSTFHFFSVVLSLTFCCCWLAVARAREFFLFSGVSRLVLRQTCDGNNLFVFFCFFVASHRVKETLRVSRADGTLIFFYFRWGYIRRRSLLLTWLANAWGVIPSTEIGHKKTNNIRTL
jgi:hypothetical protein